MVDPIRDTVINNDFIPISEDFYRSVLTSVIVAVAAIFLRSIETFHENKMIMKETINENKKIISKQIETFNKLEGTVTNLVNKDENIYKGYTKAIEKIEKLLDYDKDTKEKQKLIVFGITLNFWGYIREFIESNEAFGCCEIEIYVMCDKYFENNQHHFISTLRTVQSRIAEIKDFINDNENNERLKERDINIELRMYEATPPFHGFKINDDVLISYLYRNHAGKISAPMNFYEHFSNERMDERKNQYMELVNNWVQYLEHYSKDALKTE
jgi:hypothetical protein